MGLLRRGAPLLRRDRRPTRARCAIDLDRARARSSPARRPALDPERHYLEGSPEDVATYLLTLDAINFGSGWFPTLRKRPGCSGYFTVAWALADRFRARRAVVDRASCGASTRGDVAAVLGQEPAHELMGLYAEALHDLGRVPRRPRRARRGGRRGRLGRAPGRAARRRACRSSTTAASTSARRSRPTTWRSPASPSSPTSTGSRSSPTTSCRTCCAWTACCVYDPALAARIDAGELLQPGERGARDPRLRRARLRADRGRARRAAAQSSTSGSGTAARSRATRRCRATARGRVFY